MLPEHGLSRLPPVPEITTDLIEQVLSNERVTVPISETSMVLEGGWSLTTSQEYAFTRYTTTEPMRYIIQHCSLRNNGLTVRLELEYEYDYLTDNEDMPWRMTGWTLSYLKENAQGDGAEGRVFLGDQASFKRLDERRKVVADQLNKEGVNEKLITAMVAAIESLNENSNNSGN